MLSSKYLSVVIPAYNEDSLITATLESIPSYIDKIIVIDDCSKDSTLDKITQFKDDRLICISHEVNKGVGAAIVSGYKESLKEGIDIAIVIAGDHQMDTKHIPELIDPIMKEGYGYVKGNRLINREYMRGMSRWRRFGNRILTILNKISTGYWDISDPQNGYTAISRNCMEMLALDELYPRYGYCNHMLAMMNVNGCKVKDIPIPARYGNEKSKIVYHKYIFSVSMLLTKCYFWRVRHKYFQI